MKELYLDAELEIVKFSIADVITTSSLATTEAGGNETLWPDEGGPVEDDGPIDWGAFTTPVN